MRVFFQQVYRAERPDIYGWSVFAVGVCVFLLVGAVVVPIASTNDLRAIIFAPYALIFGWPYGLSAGIIFSILFVVAVSKLPVEFFKYRGSWVFIGVCCGAVSGGVLGAVLFLYQFTSYMERFERELLAIFFVFILPSTICGAVFSLCYKRSQRQ